MEKEIIDQLQQLMEKIAQMPTKEDLARFATKEDLAGFATKEDLEVYATKEELLQSETRLQEAIRASETRTKVFIENSVANRLDAVYEKACMTYDKQVELEQRMDQAEENIEDLQHRVGIA